MTTTTDTHPDDTTTETPAEPAPAPAPKPARKTETERKLCRCGCGQPVTKLFKPGHDARHASNLATALVEAKGAAKTKAQREIAQLSQPLQDKVASIVERRSQAAETKTTRKARKAESIKVSR